MSYNNSIIYRLSCNITGEDYYGSTTNYKRRICLHKTNTEKQNSKRKCKSRQIIDRGDYTFSIVEECNFNTKKELLIRERYYIDNYPCINIGVPYKTLEEKTQSKKEYGQSDKMLKYKKEYYINNRELLIEKQRERHNNNKTIVNQKKGEKITCECGVIFTRGHRARHLKSKWHLENIS